MSLQFALPDSILIYIPCNRKIDLPEFLDLSLVKFMPPMTLFTLLNSSLTSLITSSSNGFDGSMMNGLQSLTQWEEDFNFPTGGMLGLLNAIQVTRRFFSGDFDLIEL